MITTTNDSVLSSELSNIKSQNISYEVKIGGIDTNNPINENAMRVFCGDVFYEHQEGLYFDAALAKSTEIFKENSLVLADTLQRYTAIIKRWPEILDKARSELKQEGEIDFDKLKLDDEIFPLIEKAAIPFSEEASIEWEKRNSEILHKHNCKPTHWKKFLDDPLYEGCLTIIKNLDQAQDKSFHNIINDIANKYIKRLISHDKNNPRLKSPVAKSLVIKYLHEMAAVMNLWSKKVNILHIIDSKKPDSAHRDIVNSLLKALSSNDIVFNTSKIIFHMETFKPIKSDSQMLEKTKKDEKNKEKNVPQILPIVSLLEMITNPNKAILTEPTKRNIYLDFLTISSFAAHTCEHYPISQQIVIFQLLASTFCKASNSSQSENANLSSNESACFNNILSDTSPNPELMSLPSLNFLNSLSSTKSQ